MTTALATMTSPEKANARAEKVDREMAVVAALSRPGATDLQVAREFGLTRKRVAKIRYRHEARVTELREVRTDALVLKCDMVAERFIDMLLTRGFEAATPHQLAIAAGTMIDKARLLRGEATAIVDHRLRLGLDEAAAAVAAEMRRRGQAVELGPAEFAEVKE